MAEQVRVEDVIPAEVHGCRVKVGVGPYPPDQPRAWQKAMYAELVPISRKATDAFRHMNRKRVLGMVPLTPEGAEAIGLEPNGRLAEKVALDALREASKLVQGIDQ